MKLFRFRGSLGKGPDPVGEFPLVDVEPEAGQHGSPCERAIPSPRRPGRIRQQYRYDFRDSLRGTVDGQDIPTDPG
jgi:hypothetical protein